MARALFHCFFIVTSPKEQAICLELLVVKQELPSTSKLNKSLGKCRKIYSAKVVIS